MHAHAMHLPQSNLLTKPGSGDTIIVIYDTHGTPMRVLQIRASFISRDDASYTREELRAIK